MNLYWIKTNAPRLAIIPRPRGNDWLADDLLFLKTAGIDAIVSALTVEEAQDLGLAEESQVCERNGLDFFSFPINDRSVPDSLGEFNELVDAITKYLRDGKAVGVHCRAGIGRSSTIIASVLIRSGLSPNAAFCAIEESRGCPVPDTPEQRQWVERHIAGMI